MNYGILPYQPLDPFGHSFRYVHIAQRERRETMTAARHKLCQNSQGQKLYQIYAALMQQTLPGSHGSKACFFITVFSNLCCCLRSSGLLIRHASGMSPKSMLPHCCNCCTPPWVPGSHHQGLISLANS